MKKRLACILGLAVIASACTKEPTVEPEAAEPTEAAASAPAGASPEAEIAIGFIAHMHEHARQLEAINLALADGNLAAAQVPAYWLSRHDTVAGIPTKLQPFVIGMRRAAETVEAAPDLETARAAAAQINSECQSCHVASGI